jgi:hypothetical protein
MTGFRPMGSISLGRDLVSGSNLVPNPAAGMTAFRTLKMHFPALDAYLQAFGKGLSEILLKLFVQKACLSYLP